MLFVLLALVATASCRILEPKTQPLPHCSRSLTMEGDIIENEDRVNRSAVQFTLGLHETACLAVENNESRVIHALEFHKLDQNHPVSAKYKFAIPQITPSCICDCADSEIHCQLDEYNYKNCSKGSVCYRTYHPVQSNKGCTLTFNQKSEVCCDLKIDPFRDWTFTALRIGQPDTVVIFKYSIFTRVDGRNPRTGWRKTIEEFIEIPMNKGSARFDFNEVNHLEISVSGSRPNREVVPGMYFIRDGVPELRSGVPLNDVFGTDLSKLGWLRMADGKWTVPNGPVKMKEKFHLDVKHCTDQLYTYTFNGEQLVMVSKEDELQSFDLGQPISEDPWIERATLSKDERVVKVEHSEGIALTVNMLTEVKPIVIHHASQFQNFDGSIRVDKNSNRYMNATFFGAKGTFVGYIYSNEAKEKLDMVVTISVDSSQIKDYTTTVTVPTEIDSQRYVCFHPMGDKDAEQCKWFTFDEQQLNTFTVANKWHSGKGDCQNCNERGIEGVFASFNPKAFFDGINSPKEAIAMATELVLTGVMLLAFICLCTKCFIPLARCTLSVPRSHKK